MKSLTLFSWIAMCTLLSHKGMAQSDSLMLQVVLLEKQIMNAIKDTTPSYPLLFEKAMRYKAAALYHNGFTTLNRINEEMLPDSMKCVVHYEKAFQSYMLKSFRVALQEIWSAETCGLAKPEMRMLYLMILLENERWEDFIREYARAAETVGFHEAVSEMETFKVPVLLDPEKYEKKSRVPGAGLIASGHTGKGILSIGLQLACAGFAVYQFYYGYYFTGFFSGIQPARKFYNGGKTLSKALVRRSNRQQITALKQQGYRSLEKLYDIK